MMAMIIALLAFLNYAVSEKVEYEIFDTCPFGICDPSQCDIKEFKKKMLKTASEVKTLYEEFVKEANSCRLKTDVEYYFNESHSIYLEFADKIFDFGGYSERLKKAVDVCRLELVTKKPVADASENSSAGVTDLKTLADLILRSQSGMKMLLLESCAMATIKEVSSEQFSELKHALKKMGNDFRLYCEDFQFYAINCTTIRNVWTASKDTYFTYKNLSGGLLNFGEAGNAAFLRAKSCSACKCGDKEEIKHRLLDFAKLVNSSGTVSNSSGTVSNSSGIVSNSSGIVSNSSGTVSNSSDSEEDYEECTKEECPSDDDLFYAPEPLQIPPAGIRGTLRALFAAFLGMQIAASEALSCEHYCPKPNEFNYTKLPWFREKTEQTTSNT